MNSTDINFCEEQARQVALRIEAIRSEKNISKNELSQLSGISRSAILKIERGERTPAIATLFRFTKALDVPLWEVIMHVEK